MSLDQFSAAHLYYMLKGAGWTIVLAILALTLGGLAGFVLALARVSRNPILKWSAWLYIELIQGIPLLVLLFIVYFGLSVYGFSVHGLVAAGAGLMIYASAYLADIWRACIESVPRPQWEAAECLALSRWQTLRLVIIPQAIRLAIPPSVGFSVQLIKMTSLASVIGFVELTRSGQIINNSIFQPFMVFSLIGLMYFLLCFPLSRWSEKMEDRFNVASR